MAMGPSMANNLRQIPESIQHCTVFDLSLFFELTSFLAVQLTAADSFPILHITGREENEEEKEVEKKKRRRQN